MARKITFDALLERRSRRQAEDGKAGLIALSGEGEGLEAKMPSQKEIFDLYGELQAARTPMEALVAGKHALYACCPQLRDPELQAVLDCKADPMTVIDKLYTVAEADELGGKAFRFLGLLRTPAAPSDAGEGQEEEPETDPGLDTVKN